MYQVRITSYAGGELEIATSFLSAKSPPSDMGVEESQANPLPSILDYSSQLETASRTRLSGFGEPPARKTKFTRAASKAIQRSARALDEFAERPEDILFLTGTLPGTGSQQFEAMANYSSYIVHRLKAWVAKRVPGKMDFYCWELQKRGALHIHYAVYCPDPVASEYILNGFKEEWLTLLREVGERSGVNLFLNVETGMDWSEDVSKVQAKAERVTKSVGAYLGKYLSKSSRGTTKHGRFAPCRWYGISRPLRAYEKSLRVEHTEFFLKPGKAIEFAYDVLTFAGNMGDSIFSWVNRVGHGIGGVIFGTLPETLTSTLKIIKNKVVESMDTSLTLSQKYSKLVEVIKLARVQNRAWFEGVSRNMGSDDYLDKSLGQTLQTLRHPSGVCALQALVWKLEENTKRKVMFGGRWLDPRWRANILHCCDDIQTTLRVIYQENYVYDSSEDFYSLLLDGANDYDVHQEIPIPSPGIHGNRSR